MKIKTDAWSTSCLSHRPSEPAYYIVDCRILPLLSESSSTNEVSLLRGVGRMKCSGIIFEGACLIYAPTFFRKIFCNLHKPFFKIDLSTYQNLNNHVEFSQLNCWYMIVKIGKVATSYLVKKVWALRNLKNISWNRRHLKISYYLLQKLFPLIV